MFAAHAEAERRGMPLDELLGAHAQMRARLAPEEPSYTRRQLLAGAAALAGGAALGAMPGQSRAQGLSRSAPRIAVVGAALAGLRCAHLL